VTPGQLQELGGRATERLYSQLQLEIYHAPTTTTDFIAPNIWQVRAMQADDGLDFDVLVTDDSFAVARVVILYRNPSSNVWQAVDLIYDPVTQHATASVPGLTGPIEYFAQAVDSSGNVALALDHGQPFTKIVPKPIQVYLPLVRR
jgi:hypothetical protein